MQASASTPAPFEARRRVATVAQAAAAYPAFSHAALRDLIFKSEDRFNSRGDRIKGNGLADAGAIIRIGRKVLIDLDAFDAWLDSRAKQGRAAA
ncbi:MAG: hypothetical protein IPF57_10500 [Gammaproteobacteria bacterium]|nr:hypothetical protein [Gammaproteobacteria bacterium]MBK9467757.1 hypothetical protein [Gammaproteobacteria bacterium]MBP7910064.1 hypothetical protein [Pseudomonadales bacterium]